MEVGTSLEGVGTSLEGEEGGGGPPYIFRAEAGHLWIEWFRGQDGPYLMHVLRQDSRVALVWIARSLRGACYCRLSNLAVASHRKLLSTTLYVLSVV